MLTASLLSADDLASVAELLAMPQGGRWRLATSMPGGIAAALAVIGRPAHVVAVSAGGRPMAVGVRAVKDVRWQGRAARLGYLTLLRRDPTLPPTMAVPALRHAFAALDTTRTGDELPFDLTAIATSNERAQRLLTSGLPGLPVYRPRDVYRARVWRRTTLARQAHGLALRQVEAAEVAPLVAVGGLTLGPAAPDRPMLAAVAAGQIVACGRLDDQRAVRGLVLDLPPLLSLVRPAANAVRCLRGLPGIPRPGTVMPQASVADWHWLPGRTDAAIAVLAGLAVNAASDVTMICAGWCDDHPDGAALAACTPAAETIAARWYVIGGDPGPGAWQLDAGGL